MCKPVRAKYLLTYNANYGICFARWISPSKAFSGVSDKLVYLHLPSIMAVRKSDIFNPASFTIFGKYLNRLSDLLFALSRRLNADAGITDTKL